MNQTKYLVQELKTTRQRSESRQSNRSVNSSSNKSPTKLSRQRDYAKARYQYLTNMTKQQQQKSIRRQRSRKKKDWSHDFYLGSGSFSVLDDRPLNQFPHNNTKYNIQFLDRSLHGTGLKFPRKDSGQFKKPAQILYSSHYKPIVKEKIRFNEDWELRTSLFGKTWVDHKRQKIMDKYTIQANPFKTPKSNQLLSKLNSSYNGNYGSGYNLRGR